MLEFLEVLKPELIMSEFLCQTNCGLGFPSASHLSLILVPFFTAKETILFDACMLGASEKDDARRYLPFIICVKFYSHDISTPELNLGEN